MIKDRTVADIFYNDRSCYKFSSKKVEVSLLKEIYFLMSLGPTSANSCPLRILFIVSDKEKARLIECLDSSNIAKTQSAPVTAIFASDQKFYNKLSKLFPHNSKVANTFKNDGHLTQETAFRNSTLQAAYFMMIARSKGLDCGPMSGFNTKEIYEKFFKKKYPDYFANFLCNLGYRDSENQYLRLPRLEFSEACKII